MEAVKHVDLLVLVDVIANCAITSKMKTSVGSRCITWTSSLDLTMLSTRLHVPFPGSEVKGHLSG